MANPILTSEQLGTANKLLDEIRGEISKLAGGDPALLFVFRRKIAKELVYDERSGPNERRKLKMIKRTEQQGLCAHCHNELPKSYNVLDRLVAFDGYTEANTRLICEACDRNIQAERGYR